MPSLTSAVSFQVVSFCNNIWFDGLCRFKFQIFSLIFSLPYTDVLVTSKRPALRLPDLTAVEINDFFQTVCKVQKVAEKLYSATSSTVTVQDGPDAGQTVNQVHCHVLPRHTGDFLEKREFYKKFNRHDKDPTVARRSIEEMKAEAEMFREEFLRMY